VARSPSLTARAVTGFSVSLGNFEGPFDLLLSLISRHELDITEVSLSAVTDDFIAYLGGLDATKELDQASEFVVVAATLLDLKVVGLLPQGELVDSEGAAAFEARDLLFARLLQYRAFKRASQWIAEQMIAESSRHARSVRLEERFRQRTPSTRWSLSPHDFAVLAAVALAPREIPAVTFDHLHAPPVSIREQAAYVATIVRSRHGTAVSFRELIAEVQQKGIVVARFLAVLELYRHGALAFDQVDPLGELTLRWIGENWSDESLSHLGADYGE
jgi:segregation and condensation protein A